jgi:hypothetical protein
MASRCTMARIDYDGAMGPAEGRLYYGQRAGLQAPKLALNDVQRLVQSLYAGLEEAGWFQEWFGYYCVDADDVPGKAGPDRSGFLHIRLFIPDLWPLRTTLAQAEETTLFSVIELLYDCVSEPLTGTFHSWSNCGWHYEAFNGPKGKARWRGDVNRILLHYGEGFELSTGGEVQKLGATGVRELMTQPIPRATPQTNREKVDAAVRGFRHFSATRQHKLDAVRNLADVLEPYRQQIKASVLSRDESDLFMIANKFSIRHNNDVQKSDYSDDFIDWLFHLYLATVHLTLRLVHGTPEAAPDATSEGYDEAYDESDIPF